MAVSYVGAGAIAASTSTTVSVPLPTHQVGDLLIVVCISGEIWNQLATAPVGFTATGYAPLAEAGINGGMPMTVLAKIAGASEADPTVTYAGTATNGIFGMVAAYRGVDSAIIDTAGVYRSSSSTAPASADLTTLTTGAVMVSIAGQAPNGAGFTLGTANGFTLQAEDSSLTGIDGSIGFADKAVAATTQAGPVWSSVSNNRWGAVNLALRASGDSYAGVTPRYINRFRVGGGTTITTPLPPMAADDLILVQTNRINSNAITPPAGYSLESSVSSPAPGVILDLYYKVADGSETSAAFQIASDGGSWSLSLAVFRNVDSATPFDVAVVTGSAASGTTFAAPGVTTVSDDTLAVSFVANNGNTPKTLSTANGFARISSQSWVSSYTTQHGAGLAVLPRTAAGAVTFPTWTGNNLDWAGFSLALRVAAAVPSAPTNPAAAALSSSSIRVTWDDVADETGYRVERSPDGAGSWVDVSGNLAAGTVSYDDTGLTAATQYFYRVIAFNAAGDSSPSSTVNATTSAASGNRMGGTGAIRKPPR